MLLTAIIFILLGILVKHAKMYFLIAGYNTMSEKKKAEYDIKGVASIFRNSFVGMGIVMILSSFLSRWLEDPDIELFSLYGSLLIGIPYLLIKANSGKYKLKNRKTK